MSNVVEEKSKNPGGNVSVEPEGFLEVTESEEGGLVLEGYIPPNGLDELDEAHDVD